MQDSISAYSERSNGWSIRSTYRSAGRRPLWVASGGLLSAYSVEKLCLDDAVEDPSLIGASPFPAHGGMPATQELMTKSRYGTRRGTLDLSLLVAQHSR